jgi:prepilin-type N-terminal cleavage/methylation domain-containing protein
MEQKALMISRIGNKKTAYSVERRAYSKNKNIILSFLSAKRYPLNAPMGFTLIEVMVACAILSIGIVLIYEAFFTLLDSFGYYQHYLKISPFTNEKMWQAQDALRRLGTQAQVETNGKFTKGNRNCIWNLSYGLLDEAHNYFLYKIDLAVAWKEGNRNVKLVRSAYAAYETKK